MVIMTARGYYDIEINTISITKLVRVSLHYRSSGSQKKVMSVQRFESEARDTVLR